MSKIVLETKMKPETLDPLIFEVIKESLVDKVASIRFESINTLNGLCVQFGGEYFENNIL